MEWEETRFKETEREREREKRRDTNTGATILKRTDHNAA